MTSIAGALYCRDIQKGLERGPGSRTSSVGLLLSHCTASPTQGEASPPLDSRVGGKQMSSHREGFCCKSLINVEKLRKIKVRVSCTHLPPPSFLDFDFLPLYFLPMYIYLFFLPSSSPFHPFPSSLQASCALCASLPHPSLSLPPATYLLPPPTFYGGRGGLFSSRAAFWPQGDAFSVHTFRTR